MRDSVYSPGNKTDIKWNLLIKQQLIQFKPQTEGLRHQESPILEQVTGELMRAVGAAGRIQHSGTSLQHEGTLGSAFLLEDEYRRLSI